MNSVSSSREKIFLKVGLKYKRLLFDKQNIIIVFIFTDNVLLIMHQDEQETSVWRKKIGPIFEIVDELTYAQLQVYDKLYEEDMDEDFEE